MNSQCAIESSKFYSIASQYGVITREHNDISVFNSDEKLPQHIFMDINLYRNYLLRCLDEKVNINSDDIKDPVSKEFIKNVRCLIENPINDFIRLNCLAFMIFN